MIRILILSMLATALLPVIVGCQRDKELTRMQSEVIQAASDLVVQDAQARRDIIEMQAAIDEERRRVSAMQEDHRRRVASERSDAAIAEAMVYLASILLCLIPLFVAIRLLSDSPNDHEVDVLHLDEVLPDIPPAPAPKRLVHRDLDALVQERLNHSRD